MTAKKDEQTVEQQQQQAPSLPLATTVDALVQASKDAQDTKKKG